MTITDIINPVFRILSEQGMYRLEMETAKACREGWYPVGGVGKKDRDWVQVLMKGKDE